MRLLCTASIIYLIFLTPVYSQNTTNDTNALDQSTCPVPTTALEKPTLHNPTCSLSSQPAEPVPEFLSFEEWKAKRIVERDATNREKESHSFTASHGHVGGAQQAGIVQNETNLSNGSNGSHSNDHVQLNHSQSTKEHPVEAIASPRSHIPLIDRFNYASNECNARIQSSHKSAKSASSILSRKKDRYMLSPCQTNKEKQYVIVELCEDIRIDTVQLANFEFFSGVFKDIRVSVAHTYTNDGQGWMLMGEYTAKNIRGVQSFHPQRELSPFYRYIRIDFLSYYGSEYFCPVSLLRVYGLTQMEEWKSDVWKAEWDGSPPSSEPVSEPSVITLEGRPASTTTKISETGELSAIDAHSPLNDLHTPANETVKTMSSEPRKAEDDESAIPDISVIGTFVDHQESVQMSIPLTTSLSSTSRVSTTSEKKEEVEVPLLQPAEVVPPAPPQSTEADPSIKDENLTPITSLEPSSTMPSVTTTTSSGSISNPPVESPQTVTKTLSTTIILSAASPSAITSAVVPSGESVYRMIINRLNGLEANQTLYAKYFEEQGRIVNSRMERLEEDLGRLSAVVNSQQQHVSKLLERHRSELEFEHKKLLMQVENLAHEVLMEKRIGIAQLVILLAVLVFMALTRGSRGEPIRFSRASAAWNRGIRSSGDWVSNWRGSRTMSTTDDLLAKITEPTPALQPAFNLPSRSHKHSFERSRRSSSSRRALLNDDLFQTPPRPSRKPTRSRQSSLRNREHTPVRQPASHGSNAYGPDSPTKEFRSMTIGSTNTSNQSKSSRPPATTNWRPGRSISLSGVKGLSGPFGGSTSNLPGGRPLGTKKLAKTAHMHEVKNRSRSGTIDGREISLLSPMMEDPPSTAASSTFGSIFGNKGKENVHSSRAAGSMSLPLPDNRSTVSEGVLSNSLSEMASSSSIAIPGRQSLGIGIPFPSPDLDGDFNPSDEDHWVDEAGVDDRPPRSPSSPTGTVRRGFASPRRSFIFSSSPPGSKSKFRFRRNDGGTHPS